MQRRILLLMPVVASFLLLSGCSTSNESKSSTERKTAEAPKETPAPAEKAPAAPAAAGKTFKVRLETSKGPVLIEVHRDWAPIGAKRFEDLVKDHFFDGARFFRVLPNFVAQFGLAASPAMTKKWDKRIDDDPVIQTNRAGSLTFATAGPNTRTSQIFVNFRSNQSLDSQGFAPFAMIVEGKDVIDRVYSGYGERPDQDAITNQGNAYLVKNFPNLDYIKTAKIVE